ncbi:hypothetical protein [Spirulina major]|nr:hypothetical protein [Spirulina major]
MVLCAWGWAAIATPFLRFRIGGACAAIRSMRSPYVKISKYL